MQPRPLSADATLAGSRAGAQPARNILLTLRESEAVPACPGTRDTGTCPDCPAAYRGLQDSRSGAARVPRTTRAAARRRPACPTGLLVGLCRPPHGGDACSVTATPRGDASRRHAVAADNGSGE